MPDEPEIRYLGDVQRLTLAPEDIIVLKTTLPVHAEAAKRLREMVQSQFGENRKVLVLSDGLEIGLLSPQPASEEEIAKLKKFWDDNFPSGTKG